MSDFESRLTAALRSGAEDAPPIDRLAGAARVRARARRRTRSALVAAGAVVALVVPVGVVALTGDDDAGNGTPVAVDPPEQAPDGWQTVEHEGVLVDVPGSWQRLDTSACPAPDFRFGPPGADPCTIDHDGVGLYPSEEIDPYRPPGVVRDPESGWTGYVPVGTAVVNLHAEDREVARRILGSARTEGSEAPDLSAGFRAVSYDGLSVEVPADWQEGPLAAWCTDESVPGWVETPDTHGADVDCTPPYTGFGVRFHDGSGGSAGFEERGEPEFPDHSWAGFAILPDDAGRPIGYVEVVAPTEGLAHLIGGSLRMR